MTNPLYALTDHDHTENERNKTMEKHSKTMSMGLMPTPYLVQLETLISPGLPYLSLIGFPDEDHRRIRDRIRSACEAVRCGLPDCRTTVNLMPASMPKLPGLCVLACAVSILAADGRIPSADQLEDTIILGDVNEDGFDCKWACTKEMSWELNPQKRHHRVADLIADYHIGDVEEHRALSDAIQEQMLYQALCAEATRRGKWNERED